MRIFLLALMTLCTVQAQNVMDIVHAYSARDASRFDRRTLRFNRHGTGLDFVPDAG